MSVTTEVGITQASRCETTCFISACDSENTAACFSVYLQAIKAASKQQGSSQQQLTSQAAVPGFEDPFQQLAEQPWQQLDLDSPKTSQNSEPQPEVAPESAHSIDNMDDSVVTCSDPAACDFLLAALMFQEQKSIVKQQSLKRDVLQDKLTDLTVEDTSCSGSTTDSAVHSGPAE